MTDWKQAQGSQIEKPAEFDTVSSPTTVYQRRNVERITVEYDGTASELWQYDERTMSRGEYAELRLAAHEAAETDLDALTVDHELRLSLLEMGLEGGED